MAQSSNSPTRLSGEQFALHVARPATRMFTILIVVAAMGIYYGLRQGWTGHPQLLVGGSLAAVAGISAFGRQLFRHAGGNRQRSWGASAGAAAGLIPTLFGFYLTFYEGIWGALGVFRAFSLLGLLGRLAFVYLGYRLTVWMHALSEIPGQLSSGALVVTDSPLPQGAVRAPAA